LKRNKRNEGRELKGLKGRRSADPYGKLHDENSAGEGSDDYDYGSDDQYSSSEEDADRNSHFDRPNPLLQKTARQPEPTIFH